MSQLQVREPESFGKRKESHSIIITRNGKSRQYLVNPVHFSLLAGFIAMFGVGYFSATTYLILRDDLISAHGARTARVHYEYEDRIAALRSSLDMITSRQLLDQQAIEARVELIMERQKELSRHSPTMAPVLKKARALGLNTKGTLIDPNVPGSLKLDEHAAVDDPFSGGFYLRGVDKKQNLALTTKFAKEPSKLRAEIKTRIASISSEHFSYQANDGLFAAIDKSITDITTEQKKKISSVRNSADGKLINIAKLMKRVGVKISAAKTKKGKSQIGGPFVPLDMSANFDAHINALGVTLSALEGARKKIELVPVISPVPGKTVISKFGSRIDPFKRTYAMHAGYDFKAGYGTLIRATASGEIIFAARNGGYGKMVEIKHKNGLTTRYAHLSKISVKKGQLVSAGDNIGKVGSTGRSTGPHLHYEIRHNDKAVNPKKYLLVGQELSKLL
ncbi:MAG: M23 family metallopeptidase [Hyphomicrobiales bacterium]|nr:M23 family metallopeptidase [Hyphomicrobiales bacterium]